jgi:hypothetical protein
VISGVDQVIVSPADPASGLRQFLNGWSERWPDMRTAVDGVLGSEFFRWRDIRPDLPHKRGEILVARDLRMNEDWDEYGYRLGVDGQGPFYILYRQAPAGSLPMQALRDPFENDLSDGFEPYEVQLVGSGLSLITIVLPDADSEFSRSVMSAVSESLLGA